MVCAHITEILFWHLVTASAAHCRTAAAACPDPFLPVRCNGRFSCLLSTCGHSLLQTPCHGLLPCSPNRVCSVAPVPQSSAVYVVPCSAGEVYALTQSAFLIVHRSSHRDCIGSMFCHLFNQPHTSDIRFKALHTAAYQHCRVVAVHTAVCGPSACHIPLFTFTNNIACVCSPWDQGNHQNHIRQRQDTNSRFHTEVCNHEFGSR